MLQKYTAVLSKTFGMSKAGGRLPALTHAADRANGQAAGLLSRLRKVCSAWADRLRAEGAPVQFDDDFPGMRRFCAGNLP